jgi:hypothetical protein
MEAVISDILFVHYDPTGVLDARTRGYLNNRVKALIECVQIDVQGCKDELEEQKKDEEGYRNWATQHAPFFFTDGRRLEFEQSGALFMDVGYTFKLRLLEGKKGTGLGSGLVKLLLSLDITLMSRGKGSIEVIENTRPVFNYSGKLKRAVTKQKLVDSVNAFLGLWGLVRINEYFQMKVSRDKSPVRK